MQLCGSSSYSISVWRPKTRKQVRHCGHSSQGLTGEYVLLVPAVPDYAGLFAGYGGRMLCKGTQQDYSGYETTIGIGSLLAFKAVGPRDRCKSNLSNSFPYRKASSVCRTLEVMQSL